MQYLKKEFSYEVGVLHADKHESLLQVDSIITDTFIIFVTLQERSQE